MTLHPDILDLSPIDPPRHEKEPQGRQVAFNDVVSAAGMLNVVTLPTPPDIRLHDGTGDFLVPRLGCPVYCISEAELPTGSRERSREIMRRLAYGFFDYAAREIVARYHRDLKRSTAAHTLSNAGQEGRKEDTSRNMPDADRSEEERRTFAAALSADTEDLEENYGQPGQGLHDTNGL